MDEVLSNRKIEYFVTDFKLIPSDGGKFELTVNGDLLYSKKQLGRHARKNEIHDIVWEHLQGELPEGFEFPEEDDD